jgi:hypothetical protein
MTRAVDPVAVTADPPTARTAVLECRQLRKTFGDLVAVRDLSLRIADGERTACSARTVPERSPRSRWWPACWSPTPVKSWSPGDR